MPEIARISLGLPCVLSHIVSSPVIPDDAKSTLPDSNPSTVAVVVLIVAHVTFASETPRRARCFSNSRSCSITISGRYGSPYCRVTLISGPAASARAPSPAVTASTKTTQATRVMRRDCMALPRSSSMMKPCRSAARGARAFFHDTADERFPHADLVERDELVRPVRVADRAGPADHRLESGALELPGLRCERDLAAAAAAREPLDVGDDVRRLLGVQAGIVRPDLERDGALLRDAAHLRQERLVAEALQPGEQRMRIVLRHVADLEVELQSRGTILSAVPACSTPACSVVYGGSYSRWNGPRSARSRWMRRSATTISAA